jgi:hypothetical protein
MAATGMSGLNLADLPHSSMDAEDGMKPLGGTPSVSRSRFR